MNLQTTYELSDQALAFMRDHGIAAMPSNYEVCFGYVHGANAELKKAIDILLSNKQDLTQEALDDLYERFFTMMELEDKVMGMGNTLAAEAASLINVLSDTNKDTNNYGRTLESVSGLLSKGGPMEGMPAPVTTIIDQLVAATKHMRERSRRLEVKLEETTSEVDLLRQDLDRIRKESLTDALTNLGNRKHFDQSLRAIAAETMEDGAPMSLIIGDIDHFKSFNDTWGHQTGDQVIKLVAHCIRENVKGRDQASRYGGEEFAVVLPNTDLEGGLRLADSIRQSVQSKKVVKRSTGEDLGTITMSFGVAHFEPGEALSELIRRADTCLYAAKQGGRNMVKGEHEVDLESILGDATKKKEAKQKALAS